MIDFPADFSMKCQEGRYRLVWSRLTNRADIYTLDQDKQGVRQSGRFDVMLTAASLKTVLHALEWLIYGTLGAEPIAKKYSFSRVLLVSS